ncbi:unnamed protein product [Urochloa humidicola]
MGFCGFYQSFARCGAVGFVPPPMATLPLRDWEFGVFRNLVKAVIRIVQACSCKMKRPICCRTTQAACKLATCN